METQTQSHGGGDLSPQQRFFHYFQQEITALQEGMDRLSEKAPVGGERADAADHCLAGITRLSNEVKDASGYLPAYDQRTYAEAIKALQERLEETRKAFAPKPKFSFKSKSPSALSLSDAAELAAEKRRAVPGGLRSPNSSFSNTPASTNTPANEPVDTAEDGEPAALEEMAASLAAKKSTIDRAKAVGGEAAHEKDSPSLSTTATSISITDQSNTHIILPSSALHSQAPCTLQKITGSIVDLSVPTTETAPFASLTINVVSSSLLLCGSVSGPAHITKARNSVLVIKCRQLRMHECENVDVYLYCSSRPIIEDCKNIRFTELPKFHSELIWSGQGAVPGPDPAPNQWNQVDDFKWLKPEPSPHWSILPTEDRIPDETWREVVPGGPGWSVKDILKSVGLSAPGRN
ncbi:hypothetical protein A1O3_01947 [Capronia epimyces CBS 606.96]|uniref:C-CAP/cofactor C-like domain-containing protein n=1 Tax=Capronia epimyces CBS 606.96 TaxID=1182542 RepID=W9Y8Q4_9EURO|nr:uncharacterized protein A1O3_01947 [Capronia epimyces CBS 606.96]EXJ88883.1 hypothetical protein A1O3_01947 [Capronia epimyces CBS 606.96]